MKPKVSLFWFRRDLRLEDNTGLLEALKGKFPVVPIFIFDTSILNSLSEQDKRIPFIHEALLQLKNQLQNFHSDLKVLHHSAEGAFHNLLETFDIQEVYTNRDYEPEALERDKKIKNLLQEKNIPFHTFKDHVIFEKDEILKKDGLPYTLFTPYARKWKEKLQTLKWEDSVFFKENLYPLKNCTLPSLKELGFSPTTLTYPETTIHDSTLAFYHTKRDFPSWKTSEIGVHLRFGTISIRECVSKAKETSDTWLNQLIWRDFFIQILYHFPHVVQGSFKKQYDQIEWINDEEQFEKWCTGNTGYPLVDAGMRQLVQTGHMHNRVRMLTASFLSKHLLIDWRWGEAFFAEHLLDYELASNNGNWQWAAGSGCDSTPYFRIFNPLTQQKKFDPHFEYIQKWIPEFNSTIYPQPIIDHVFARERTLKTYKNALRKI